MENMNTDTLQALAAIQSALEVPRSNYNNFGGFSYHTTSDILRGLKPLLKEHQAVVRFDDELISKGERVYVKSTAYFHCKGGFVTGTGFAREETNPTAKKGAGQETGSAETYARKSALNALFLVSEDSADPDNHQPQKQNEQFVTGNSYQEQQRQMPTTHAEQRRSTVNENTQRPKPNEGWNHQYQQQNEQFVTGNVCQEQPRQMSETYAEQSRSTVNENTPRSKPNEGQDGTQVSTNVVNDQANNCTSDDVEEHYRKRLEFGIDIATQLGATFEQVNAWESLPDVKEAIREVATFVSTKQQETAEVKPQ